MKFTSNIKPATLANCQEAAEIITQGGVVCFPTETVYALAASPHCPAALERLYRLKRRDKTKAIALLCSRLEVVAPYVEISPIATHLMQVFSPGPLTLILPCCHSPSSTHPPLEAPKDALGCSLGIRIPAHDVALQIIAAAGGIVAATSANLSGLQSAITAAEIVEIFGESIDLIIDGGKATLGIASTILDMRTSPPKLLREGSLPYQTILDTLI